MAFQSTVRADQGFAIPGEIVFDGPLRAQPNQIDPSATAANCVVGRMFSVSASTGLAIPGSGGAAVVEGTNRLLGILAMPKNYASLGTSAGGSLAPTLVVPVGSIGEFVEMGLIAVTCTNAAVPGDQPQYNTTTGVISIPAVLGTADAANALIPNCSVDRVSTTGAGTILLKMTGLK